MSGLRYPETTTLRPDIGSPVALFDPLRTGIPEFADPVVAGCGHLRRPGTLPDQFDRRLPKFRLARDPGTNRNEPQEMVGKPLRDHARVILQNVQFG